jgi:hypothetical protein
VSLQVAVARGSLLQKEPILENRVNANKGGLGSVIAYDSLALISTLEINVISCFSNRQVIF